MKKIKKFFVKWFNWFFCMKTIKKEDTSNKETNKKIVKAVRKNSRKKVEKVIPKEEDYKVEVAEKRKRLKNKSKIK